MKKHFGVIYCIALCLVACTKQNQENIEKTIEPETVTNDDKTNEALAVTTEVTSQKEAFIKAKKHLANNKKVSLKINGDKFIASKKQLVKGSIVYNTATKEKGTIKGTFVVIAKDNLSHLKASTQWENIEKIANNTFRLELDALGDIYQTYQNLLKDEQISMVELEVDYSPIKPKRAEF